MAAKRLNKKVVLLLSLFASFCMIVLSVIMLRQLQGADPSRFEALAQQAEHDGDYEGAVLFYQKAWERSGNPEYLVMRGDAALEWGEIGQALNSWRKAIIKDPSLIDARKSELDLRLQLGQLYGDLQSWLAVAESADAMLTADATLSDDDKAFAHHANGLALTRLGSQDESNPERGREELESALELDPENVEFALSLARDYASTDRKEQGMKIIRDLVARHTSPGEDSTEAHLTLASFLAREEPHDAAEPWFRRAIELTAGDAASIRKAKVAYAAFLTQQWARLSIRTGNEDDKTLLEQAKNVLQEAVKDDVDAFEPYIHLASMYQQLLKRPQDAVKVCEERLSRKFSRKGIEAARNRMNVFLLNIQASHACVDVAEDQTEVDDARQWFDRAEAYLVDARGEAPNDPRAFFQLGRLRLAQGRESAALEAFRSADNRYKTINRIDWNLKKSLVQLHIRLRQPGAAVELCEEVARKANTRDVGFFILYAQALMQTGELERAQSIIDPLLVASPDLEPARQLLAAILERRGEAGRAGRYVESPAVTAVLEAKERVIQGDRNAALEILMNAHDRDPGDLRLTGTLVAELVRLERYEDARRVLDEAIAAAPDSMQLGTLNAWIDPDLTDEERDALIQEAVRKEPDAYVRALAIMDFHFQRGNFAESLEAVEEAQRLWIEDATQQSRDAPVRALQNLVRLQLHLGWRLEREDVMDRARNIAMTYDVDGAEGKTIAGLYHMLREQWELAANAFSAALETQSSNAEIMGNLGECMLMIDNLDDAETYLERAIRINPNQAIAHRGLARLAKSRGNTNALKYHLATCRRLIPNDPWVRAEVLIQNEQADPEAAVARRQAIYETDPDDLINLRRLAALCVMQGKIKAADGYYETLLEKLPDDHRLVSFVAAFYRNTNRPEKALGICEAYANAADNDENRALGAILMATHYVNVSDLDAARDQLLQSAARKETLEVCRALGEFYQSHEVQPTKAVEWFDKAAAIAATEKRSEIPAIWGAKARCFLHRSVQDLDSAQKIIDRLRAEYPRNKNALLLQSEIHVRRGNADAAVETLSAYLSIVPNDADAVFLRARQRLAVGQTGAAIEDLQSIRRTNPAALEYQPRLLLAALYRQTGRTSQWLNELESIVEEAPDSAKALGELANAYVNQERFADAERIITSTINRKARQADPAWYSFRASVSAATQDYEKALPDFLEAARLSGQTPDTVLAVLGAYLETAELADAMTFFERDVPQATRDDAVVMARFARVQARAGRSEQAVQKFREAMTAAVDIDLRTTRRVVAEVASAFPSTDPSALFTRFPPDEQQVTIDRRIDAHLRWQRGEREEATAIVKELAAGATGDKERAQLLELYGDMLTAQGKPQEARTAYEDALVVDGDNWVLLNNLAFLLADSLGQHETALPYAERAVASTETAFTLDTLGWICVGLGNYERAIAELNQAVRLDSGSVEAYFHLGEAYRRSGQFLKAASTLKRANEVAENAATPSQLQDAISTALERTKAQNREP